MHALLEQADAKIYYTENRLEGFYDSIFDIIFYIIQGLPYVFIFGWLSICLYYVLKEYGYIK